jgi:hypothetical protein
MKPNTPYTVQFTHLEMNALLRALAIANDSQTVEKQDIPVNTWLAHRILNKLNEGADAS